MGRDLLVVGERQLEPDLGHVERVEQRGGDELGQQVAGIGAGVRGDRPPLAAQAPQRGRHHAEQQGPRLLPQQGLYLIGAYLQRAPQMLGEVVLPGAVAEQGFAGGRSAPRPASWSGCQLPVGALSRSRGSPPGPADASWPPSQSSMA